MSSVSLERLVIAGGYLLSRGCTCICFEASEYVSLLTQGALYNKRYKVPRSYVLHTHGLCSSYFEVVPVSSVPDTDT